jgi:hypothetical protein
MKLRSCDSDSNQSDAGFNSSQSKELLVPMQAPAASSGESPMISGSERGRSAH